MTATADIEAVLEDGRRLISPPARQRAALDSLAAAGLIRVTRDQVARCADAQEALTSRGPRACSEWVQVPGDTTEQDVIAGAIVCPACGTELRLWERGRPFREQWTVAADEEGIRAWMEAAVHKLDPHARRLREGLAWLVSVGDRDITLVWLDRSLDTRLATRAYASAQTVVYVVTTPRRWSGRFREDPWLEPVSLGEWFERGDAVVLESVARRLLPPLAQEPAARPWASSRSPEPFAFTRALGARRLLVGRSRATLDEVEIVGPEGTSVLGVLRALVLRWREDLADGKSPEDFCVWTPEEILAALQDSGTVTTDSPPTIRRQLARLRTGISERYQRATGIRLADDEVIENVSGLGYRINPSRILALLA